MVVRCWQILPLDPYSKEEFGRRRPPNKIRKMLPGQSRPKPDTHKQKKYYYGHGVGAKPAYVVYDLK